MWVVSTGAMFRHRPYMKLRAKDAVALGAKPSWASQPHSQAIRWSRSLSEPAVASHSTSVQVEPTRWLGLADDASTVA